MTKISKIGFTLAWNTNGFAKKAEKGLLECVLHIILWFFMWKFENGKNGVGSSLEDVFERKIDFLTKPEQLGPIGRARKGTRKWQKGQEARFYPKFAFRYGYFEAFGPESMVLSGLSGENRATRASVEHASSNESTRWPTSGRKSPVGFSGRVLDQALTFFSEKSGPSAHYLNFRFFTEIYEHLPV